MMYVNASIEAPKFRMETTEYNNFVNSITDTLETGCKPVRVGLVLRTTYANLIALPKNGEYVLPIEIHPNNNKGYFSVIHSIRNYLIETFGESISESIHHTVLMPIGVYEQDGEIVLYFNLIIEDEHCRVFQHSNLVFYPMEVARGLKNKSSIVIPTLTEV